MELEVNILRAIYIIIVPIVYEIIMNGLKNKKCLIFGIVVNYIITVVYMILSFKLTSEWIFEKNCTEIANISFYIYIGLTIIAMMAAILSKKISIEALKFINKPINHTIWAILISAVVILSHDYIIKYNLDLRVFNNKNYQISITSIDIVPITEEDISEVISGNIYYKNRKNNSISYIDKSKYKVERTESGIDSIPRVDIHKYYKEYKELYSEYFVYEINIPSKDGWIIVAE